jgi:hypothetical protein
MMINIDDVVDGALVSAIAVAGRRISVAVDGLRGRRRSYLMDHPEPPWLRGSLGDWG